MERIRENCLNVKRAILDSQRDVGQEKGQDEKVSGLDN